MADPKWADDRFLDELRRQTDPLADAAVADFLKTRSLGEINYIFQTMRSDDQPILATAPESLQAFVRQTEALPPDLDLARLDRASEVFLRHAASACMVLLASSLPNGYAAPCLTHILMISRDLAKDPFKRLMGVLQLLVNITSRDAFAPGGLAVVTAQKLRLLHAGVRVIVRHRRPGYEARYGPAVNHEDMLATLMAFSHLVIDGLRKLDLGLTDEQAEDYYYLWRVYALLMGIHPPGAPLDDSFVPQTVEDAAQFYASYTRRQFTGPEENPSGVLLTQDNVDMIVSLLPTPLRHTDLQVAPQIVMAELMGPEGMARVGVKPVEGHAALRESLHLALCAEQTVAGAAPCGLVESLSRHLFDKMIDSSRGGAVQFIVPGSVADLRGAGLA
ncbi:MAG TPA: oxygenase MpaB family protein [Thermoanaerobaculia bacterium]|nr:oxygenase MpaB family protein [Thermoanaerobaculia bacterium]